MLTVIVYGLSTIDFEQLSMVGSKQKDTSTSECMPVGELIELQMLSTKK